MKYYIVVDGLKVNRFDSERNTLYLSENELLKLSLDKIYLIIKFHKNTYKNRYIYNIKVVEE